jgi:hypothetical protein
VLAELGRVLSGGEDDESEERGVRGVGDGNGEDGWAGVVLGCGEDVVCCADGEVARRGRGEVAGFLNGGRAWNDEVQLIVEVGVADGSRLGKRIHIHRRGVGRW